MATASIFKDLIEEYMEGVVVGQYEKVNGSKDAPNYLHESLLTPEYSADMTYNSISGSFTRVTADIVSFDSPLPIKSRASMKSASGEIPKIGMKFILNEKQMNTLRILRNTPGRKLELARKIFQDSENAIFGIKERLEEALLLGISSGVTIIPEADNTGTAVRVDYNIPASNQFGVTKIWSDETSKPLSDIKNAMKEARSKGEYPNTIWMGSDTVENLFSNDQIRLQFAFNQNINGTADNVPMLDQDQIVSLFSRTLKLNLIVVDRTFVHEKNGKKTVSEGWAKDMVVLTTGTNLGSLVYSTLAEEEFPVEGVSYTKANDYILVSKWGTTDPVSEATGGQAIVFPILQNVESIFYINSEEATASLDEQTEGDAVYTYQGTDYTKASVVAGLNAAGAPNSTVAQQDATLAKKIDGLSEEGVKTFEAELVEST
ncbi:major capsid protein [Leeuwenhoekiella sp. MAR_2009_132]|uniref:major capsid protein n=1 Tax=Leeuwenhoekiella sp. MAR_2009_132 TaxID=1392489 RepID=UPI00048D65D4|nr:major capsid protein [Leeuwenhoekiella sp. MAR_2009_132]